MNQDTFTAQHLARADQRRAHLEQLEDQITELAAHIHAATYRLLELIREYDLSEGWFGPGLNSCAHWLNWKCGISLGAAREKVRVAHALAGLPQISAAFRRGRVSYSKVRAMTRVAKPENEEFLLNIALHGTAQHVERLVRHYRQVKRNEALAEENSRHAQRELNWHVDDNGYWVCRGRFTPEQGALIQSSLEAAMEAQFQEAKNVPAGTSFQCTPRKHGSNYGRPDRDLGPFRPSVAPTILDQCTLSVQGEVGNALRDLRRQDVDEEPTGMYQWRVSQRGAHLPQAPDYLPIRLCRSRR